MTLTNFDKRMFEQARLEAEKSTFGHFCTGCVITYKNKIIGRGHNSCKTHPMQQKYNKQYRSFNTDNGGFIRHSVHAEISAISSVPYIIGTNINWSKVKIFVYRICRGKRLGFGNARPCEACSHAIKDLGIRDVYFTDDAGYAYLRMC